MFAYKKPDAKKIDIKQREKETKLSEYQPEKVTNSIVEISSSVEIDAALPKVEVKPARTYSEVVYRGTGIHVEIENKHWPSSQTIQHRQNTDPQTPEGAAWLRAEYEKIYSQVKDPNSKPPQDILDRIINRNLKLKTDRTGLEVYWEHILLRYCGDCSPTQGENYLELDMVRNYASTLNFAITGDLRFSAKGLNAVRISAAWLNYWLATTTYNVYDTLIRDMGNGITHATESWIYRDPVIHKNQVNDGFDWFEIKHGEITDMMIRYTVEPITN